MKFLTLAAFMIMSLYASPLGDVSVGSVLAKRDGDHDSDHHDSMATTATPPVPPGNPVADTSKIDIPGIPSKALVPWQALVSLNPQLNPDFIPAGAVVRLPPGTVWIARPGETILTVAKHFVKCATTASYIYGPKITLDPYLLARMNGVYSISTPLAPGMLIRLPPDAGYLAFAPTKFAFISRYLSFMGPTPFPY